MAPAGTLTAAAVVLAGAPAEAAAEAVDPIILPPDNYEYAFFLEELVVGGTVEPGDFAGVGLFATDSRFAEPLWSFGVAVRGGLETKSDLMIDFVSNSILGAFLSS